MNISTMPGICLPTGQPMYFRGYANKNIALKNRSREGVPIRRKAFLYSTAMNTSYLWWEDRSKTILELTLKD